jgi:hypothetical protein
MPRGRLRRHDGLYSVRSLSGGLRIRLARRHLRVHLHALHAVAVRARWLARLRDLPAGLLPRRLAVLVPRRRLYVRPGHAADAARPHLPRRLRAARLRCAARALPRGRANHLRRLRRQLERRL